MNRRRFLRCAAASTAGICLAGVGYARFEAGWIRATRHTIGVPRLPAPFVGKTIALLTDPHHGPFNGLSLLNQAVELINGFQPDLIALGGDYIQEGHGTVYVDACLEALGHLRAPLGVYAVPGNHDHNHDQAGGIQAVRRAIRVNGISDLTNAGCWIELEGNRLRIGGVDDLWFGNVDVKAALGDATMADAALLLCHNPDVAETLRDRRVSLMLSGHMHGGQVVVPAIGPRCLPSHYGRKYLQGLVQAPVTQVFVSRGLGTTGIPLRFRCRPEINLLRLAAA